MKHITVLQAEAVSTLNLRDDSVVVDCTLGSGGHAKAILDKLGKKGRYLGIDADPTAIEDNADLQSSYEANVKLIHGNFRDLSTILASENLPQVDAILADLGWRMEQFSGDTALPRGFSFSSDEPLYMTFGNPQSYPFTAADIVNDWAEEDIANVIYAYGEERFSRRIAKHLVEARKKIDITTAKQLAELVAEAVPKGPGRQKTHPATKTFQALRIAVNDEFEALTTLLNDGFTALTPGGRMAIISFHSLEDRIVKETFKTFVRAGEGALVHKKPIAPTFTEVRDNPRARSAKLRTIEKL